MVYTKIFRFLMELFVHLVIIISVLSREKGIRVYNPDHKQTTAVSDKHS